MLTENLLMNAIPNFMARINNLVARLMFLEFRSKTRGLFDNLYFRAPTQGPHFGISTARQGQSKRMSKFGDMMRFESHNFGLVHANGEERPKQQLLHPVPALVLTRSAEQDDHSPRRFASLFTRKRDVSGMFESRTEQLPVKISLTQQCTDSSRVDAGLSTWEILSPAVAPKRKRIRLNTERRRAQCRTNQARYRLKQRGFVRELECDVLRLRAEVRSLNEKRYALCYGIQTQRSIWSVVVEYFRLLRHGFFSMPHDMKADDASSPTSSASMEPNLQEQEYFLKSAMSSDVAFGELIGIDALVGQLRRISTYFGNLHCHLKEMEEQSYEAMFTTATLECYHHRNNTASGVSSSVGIPKC
ncbi:unnamed protein product [Phytophthora lilii]|uniref:Unnamed protein product n=1 Tax=Phytophthora lilii TaxID=2077276 RepID=A0A9W6THM1_9STRA|nr:unnamed protein product [Phytophthora lilii]